MSAARRRSGEWPSRGEGGRNPGAAARGRRGVRAWWFAAALGAVALGGGVTWWARSGNESPGMLGGLGPGSAKGFDVVLVTLDTTRADYIGCYGRALARTPTLDRLAGEGVRFAQALSPVPLTLPAHASILTGLDPQHHGARSNGSYRAEESLTTLPELFREAGYATAGFVSAFVLDRRFGLAQGMETFDDTVSSGKGNAFGGMESQRSAGAVTDAALAWWKQRDLGRPSFLWVHYYDPHDPYQPPEPYATQHAGRPYDGEIAYMDAQLGRLVEELRRGPRADRTLVVVAGDHGESLDEHDEYSHGRTLYEATQRVPLVFWSPAMQRRGVVVDAVSVGLVDIFPTVTDLAGLPAVDGLDGQSLLRATPDPNRLIYMETLETYLENGWAPLYALRRHADKYIHAPKPEYYDLRADPHEVNNLYAQLTPAQQAEVAALAQDLAERVQNSPSAEEVAKTAVTLDPAAIDKLRSLGYFGRDPSDRPASDEALANPRDMLPVYRLVLEAERLSGEGRLEEALVVARQAVERSPSDRQAMHRLGMVCLYLDRHAEAEQQFLAFNAIRENANVTTLLGQISLVRGNYAEAEQRFARALELDPHHGGVYIAMADLSAMRGDIDEARRLYQRALEVDPHRAKAVVADRLAKVEELSRMGAGGGVR